MNDVAGLLQQSAALVKTWGESRLPSGKTLAEALTVYGIPLWDAFVVDLARLHLPRALARGGRRPSLAERVRPHLSLAKDTALGLMRSRPGLQGCPEWPSVPTVLLLGFSAYIYRDVLQSVAARLASRSDVHPVSLYDGRCAGATASSVDHRGFHAISQHWDGGRGSGELRRALAAAVADLYTSGALPKIIRDQEGRPLWRQTRDTFNRVFRVYLPRLLPLAAVAHHIVDSHRPALIVSPDVADPRTRLYTLIAGRCGIPTLEVQFGACGPEHIEWRFMAADRVAAWGKQSAEMLVVHGVTP